MVIVLNFTKNTEEVPFATQEKINSYIHRVLGSDNKYHDTFSDYAISSLQGGKKIGESLNFANGGKILISSDSDEFLSEIFEGCNKHKILGWGMELSDISFKAFKVGEFCDKVQTISPILLRDSISKNIITIKDSNFIEELEKNCYAKLKHFFNEKELYGFRVELNKAENAKYKKILVGKTVNECSQVRLRISGSKEVRRKLYTLGLGKSTGCGFGFVEILTR